MKKLLLALFLLAASTSQAQFKPNQVLNASALNSALAAPTITGGTINGAPIGSTSASTGTFTDLTILGSLNYSGLSSIVLNPGVVGTINNMSIGLTTPQAGAFTSVAATSLTVNGTAIVGNLSGATTAIGGAQITAGSCSSTTVSIGSSTTAMTVVTTPRTSPGDQFFWKGYVSTPGTVTVKVCAVTTGTPVSSAYNVRVIQ